MLIFWFYYYYFVSINHYKENNSLKYEKKKDSNVMDLVFSNIYKTKFWGVGSGMGSYKECTKEYLIFLYKFIMHNKIKRIIDFGCGDWQMLCHFNFSSDMYYYGYDVVKELVVRNNYTYKKSNINFYYLNNIEEKIEDGDLIMTKDVLQHWENKYVKYYLNNILTKYKYGIIVNDYKNNTINQDIKTGKTRPLNLELHPFFYKDFSYHYDMTFCNTRKRIYIKS